MKVLGIETSCDETAMSVLEVDAKQKAQVLSNVISSQVKIHAKYGGVYPALAAREHAKNIDKVLKLTLKEAGLYKGSPTSLKLRRALREIDLIAVTAGPGLAVALIVGITFAKTLAWKYKKPIIGTNHLEGHIYSNWLPLPKKSSNLASFSNQIFPALNLIVSGGHTELVLMKDHGQYKLIGETMDDAAGEAFDKIARLLGLDYPGGPLISAESEKFSKKDRELGVVLPRPMINSKNFNFSFSGLKTAVLYLVKDLVKKYSLTEIRCAIAHEAQQSIVDVLVFKTMQAVKKYKVNSVLLSGGVSANKLLRKTLANKITKETKGIKFYKPLLAYTTDNAAMIALAGYFKFKKIKSANFSWRKIKLDTSLKLEGNNEK